MRRRDDKRRGWRSQRDECESCGPQCKDTPEDSAGCSLEEGEDAHKVEWHWVSDSGDKAYSYKERRGPGGGGDKERDVEWHWVDDSKGEAYSYKEQRREADRVRRQAWEAAHAHMREHWNHHRRMSWRQHWRMSQLGHFVRARLHRRLFLWFGLSIFLTCVVVATVFNLVGGTTWKQEMERMRNFAGHRFEEVWDEPARRDALAQSIAKDLDVDVEIKDASGQVLVLAGGLCKHTEISIPVMRGDTTLGQARLCYGSKRGKEPLKFMLPMLAACLVLWMAAGKMARRLAKPVDVLVQATEALGAGRLNARAEVHPHATGEFAVLGVAFNDMARRIEKQVADQRELLAAVSHELRTPLARLRVLTELLRDGGGNPKTLDQVDREVVELDALVGELLASSRLDFGQITPRVLDGRTLAIQALERAGLAPEMLDMDTPDAGLVGDATLLGRALANLLDNARRHGGGALALRIQRREEHLAFCVEDRGPGFQEGEAARIFQPFYRKDQSAEAREAGSLGLGLALVERIAQAHDGTTFAENREGGGARVGFTVRKAGPVRDEKPAVA
ncbi:sensor histidine kinase [Myxococcus landrumensis]|uniref:histidine kinase n=1 Tax=Myxococcus landrumensis TaxID=2813577 RepID=A0ABX7N968_9BACT|nr:ATP-binding protein [Myxococcus landrumus]QSQ13966.1 HAMP domain-containing protein [Myxococcus landrumus]